MWSLATLTDAFIAPSNITYPHPALYTAAWLAVWGVYGFAAGMVGLGLWIIGHECGHQAFSESKTINNTVGWFLHSAYVGLHPLLSIPSWH